MRCKDFEELHPSCSSAQGMAQTGQLVAQDQADTMEEDTRGGLSAKKVMVVARIARIDLNKVSVWKQARCYRGCVRPKHDLPDHLPPGSHTNIFSSKVEMRFSLARLDRPISFGEKFSQDKSVDRRHFLAMLGLYRDVCR